MRLVVARLLSVVAPTSVLAREFRAAGAIDLNRTKVALIGNFDPIAMVE